MRSYQLKHHQVISFYGVFPSHDLCSCVEGVTVHIRGRELFSISHGRITPGFQGMCPGASASFLGPAPTFLTQGFQAFHAQKLACVGGDTFFPVLGSHEIVHEKV